MRACLPATRGKTHEEAELPDPSELGKLRWEHEQLKADVAILTSCLQKHGLLSESAVSRERATEAPSMLEQVADRFHSMAGHTFSLRWFPSTRAGEEGNTDADNAAGVPQIAGTKKTFTSESSTRSRESPDSNPNADGVVEESAVVKQNEALMEQRLKRMEQSIKKALREMELVSMQAKLAEERSELAEKLSRNMPAEASSLLLKQKSQIPSELEDRLQAAEESANQAWEEAHAAIFTTEAMMATVAELAGLKDKLAAQGAAQLEAITEPNSARSTKPNTARSKR